MIKTIVNILYIVVCIVLSVVVLMQEGKQAGLGAITGSQKTYWAKNKGRSKEGQMVLLTRILIVAFFVLSLLLSMNIWS